MKLSVQELELEAKALLKRAARIEAEASAQRVQARQLIEHLAEVRPPERGERKPA